MCLFLEKRTFLRIEPKAVYCYRHFDSIQHSTLDTSVPSLSTQLVDGNDIFGIAVLLVIPVVAAPIGCLLWCLSSKRYSTNCRWRSASSLIDSTRGINEEELVCSCWWRRRWAQLPLLAVLGALDASQAPSYIGMKTLEGRLQKLVGNCNLPILQQVWGPAIEKQSSNLQSPRRSSTQAANVPVLLSERQIIVRRSTRLLIVASLLLLLFLRVPSTLAFSTLFPACYDLK